MPRWVRLAARFPVLLELLRAGNVDSSGSNGVGRGEGKWMFVRSGREPPVLCVAGIRVVVLSWSADGKMLKKGEREKSHRSVEISAWADPCKITFKKGRWINRNINWSTETTKWDMAAKGTPAAALAYFTSVPQLHSQRLLQKTQTFNVQHSFLKISVLSKTNCSKLTWFLELHMI